jgi:hypothetical protein
MGNPYLLSPKARLKSWLGFGFPFDRHDWQVDRGDRQVHYVIDYYYNPSGPANAPAAGPEDPTAPVLTTSIHVDVRPAVADWSSAWDRLRRFPERALHALRRPRFVAEGIDPSKVPPEELAKAACVSESEKKANQAEDLAEARAAQAAQAAKAAGAAGAAGKGQEQGGGGWAEVESRCQPILERLKGELSAEERRGTAVALNYCMGRALCPSEAGAFMRALEGSKVEGEEEQAFEAMKSCVVSASRARQAQEAAAAAAAGSSSSGTALR